MEKAFVRVYQSTSDASGIYHDSSGLSAIPYNGAADCGNLAAHIANSTFYAPQTIYVPLVQVAVVPPDTIVLVEHERHAFFDALLNPGKPSQKAMDAARRYREKLQPSG
jgi:hypothetical protein